jgi:hypothetical protein
MLKSFNSIWMPSVNTEMYFSEMTHYQEKILAKAAKQSSPQMTSFCKALDSVMAENCHSKDHPFNIIDRLYYAIYTRGMCFSNELKYSLECHCGEQLNFNTNINDIVAKLNYETDPHIVRLGEYNFTIDWPTVSSEWQYRKISESDNSISVVPLYVKKIEISNHIIDLIPFTYDQKNTLLTSLNPDIYYQIENSVVQFLKNEKTKEIIFEYNCPSCGDMIFNLTSHPSHLYSFVLSIYNCDLRDLYIKELNYATMYPGQNVNEVVPIERDYMVTLKTEIAQQNRDAKQFENKFGDFE